jgi:isocitrate dehydrogenase
VPTTDTDLRFSLRARFHLTVQAIYESDYATDFEKLGIWYEHRLIDDVSSLALLSSLGAEELTVLLRLNRWSPR